MGTLFENQALLTFFLNWRGKQNQVFYIFAYGHLAYGWSFWQSTSHKRGALFLVTKRAIGGSYGVGYNFILKYRLKPPIWYPIFEIWTSGSIFFLLIWITGPVFPYKIVILAINFFYLAKKRFLIEIVIWGCHHWI